MVLGSVTLDKQEAQVDVIAEDKGGPVALQEVPQVEKAVGQLLVKQVQVGRSPTLRVPGVVAVAGQGIELITTVILHTQEAVVVVVELVLTATQVVVATQVLQETPVQETPVAQETPVTPVAQGTPVGQEVPVMLVVQGPLEHQRLIT